MDQSPLSDIFPQQVDQSPQSKKSDLKPSLATRLKLLWLRTRLKLAPFRSKISATKTKRIFRRYWWAIIPVVLILGGLGTYWYLDHAKQQAWTEATDHYRRADYTKAAPILLSQPMPESAEQLRIYGQTMQATNHPDKALEAYNKLYQQDKDPFAQLIIGNIYNQQKQYDKAIQAYQEVINKNPEYIQAYINLATVHRLQGQNSKAIQSTQQALQNNPNSILLAELALSLSVDNKESEEYKQAVQKLRKLDPENILLKQ